MNDKNTPATAETRSNPSWLEAAATLALLAALGSGVAFMIYTAGANACEFLAATEVNLRHGRISMPSGQQVPELFPRPWR